LSAGKAWCSAAAAVETITAGEIDERQLYRAWPFPGTGVRLPNLGRRFWDHAAGGDRSVARTNYLFTSESVSEGHPDKVCDQISDAILDAFLENDIKLGIADESKVNTRLGCETLCTTNKIVVAGEGRGQAPLFHKHGEKAVVNREMIAQIARDVVKDIGYDQDGFSYYGADVEVLLHGQSPDIAMGVDAKKHRNNGEEHEGAGDQGMMFGFACTESEVYEKGSFMPAPIYFAHKILKVLSEKRRSGALFDLQPDAKSQVTIKYVDGKPVGCTKVVVSTQHNAQSRNGRKYSPGTIKEMISDTVATALPEDWMPKKPSDFLVNPTGNFVVGGPDGDCGLTGRKIIVDTYGGYAPHGGGAFSGKDPTKVDRSAAYAARYLAKNVVAAGLADSCTIQIAYAIGVADPMSLYVDTHGTGKVDEAKLQKLLPELFPLRPTHIRRTLKLNRPIYRRTAAYGHFGRAPDKDGGFSWERTDLADALKRALR
jgi:S-adenosylmethionine synthetase